MPYQARRIGMRWTWHGTRCDGILRSEAFIADQSTSHIRAFRLAGRKEMVFGAMYFCHRTTPRSFCRLKEQRSKDPLPSWTNLTITCERRIFPMAETDSDLVRLFSCCCARVDISWVFRTVCGCYAHNWRCDNPCLTEALIQDSLFYSIGVVS